jgi:hypothetical protein
MRTLSSLSLAALLASNAFLGGCVAAGAEPEPAPTDPVDFPREHLGESEAAVVSCSTAPTCYGDACNGLDPTATCDPNRISTCSGNADLVKPNANVVKGSAVIGKVSQWHSSNCGAAWAVLTVSVAHTQFLGGIFRNDGVNETTSGGSTQSSVVSAMVGAPGHSVHAYETICPTNDQFCYYAATPEQSY